jgi:NADPH:quinone reductase-like Zn-dependent oxidoreductase
MKAVVCTKYGSPEVLQVREVDQPIPKDNEVLIHVRATSVHRGDTRIRSLDIPGPNWQKLLARLILGFRKPRNAILGMELSGVIVETGKDVAFFEVGDHVFASTLWSGFGGYAEYKTMAEDGVLCRKPANLTFEEAAVIPSGGITSLGIINMAGIKPGDKVLIYGASGSVGTFSVQMAKAQGALITGVCSGSNADLVTSLGAEKVIDYMISDFNLGNESYDVIFDAVGYLPPAQAKKSLKETGTYLNVHTASDKIKKTEVRSLLGDLKELIENGKLIAVIDRSYPLDEIVEAHRYVDTGRKRGNVAITLP